MDIIFGEFFLLYQVFFFSQVKWNMIISNTHGINEFLHKFILKSSNLRLRIKLA